MPIQCLVFFSGGCNALWGGNEAHQSFADHFGEAIKYVAVFWGIVHKSKRVLYETPIPPPLSLQAIENDHSLNATLILAIYIRSLNTDIESFSMQLKKRVGLGFWVYSISGYLILGIRYC